YWGWDPVENTSLVPWLCTADLVHGMFLQRSRKRHRKINLLLASFAYVTILYGTFLTRSGILADFSVHSFVDLGITGWLVGILLAFLALSLALVAWRWRTIPVETEEEPPALSRSVLFILGIAAFSALSFVILLGTSAPLITRLSGNPAQVQTAFYNRTTAPAALLIALLAALVGFVSWKGESAAGLFASARRSLAVAGAGVAIAFLLGADEPGSLAILFAAFFAADMNLRAVIRKTRNGKFAGAGGYLAHVGVGIMLAGIVVSGVYAKSTRVTLPVDEPVQVAGSELTFLRVVPATSTAKQAMEVRVKTPQGKIFYAYPKMYTNARTNQLMANPAIRKSAVADFYVAPQSYDPGQPEQVGRDVRLTRGTTQNIEGIGLTFRQFNADRSAMMRGEKAILVLADVTITPPDGINREATLRYVFQLDGREAEAPEAEIPGVPGGKMRVIAVSPNDGAAVLRLRGISKDPAAEYQAATTESLSVDVTRKPLISLVWGGFYVLMAGATLALVKRSREARRAVLAESHERPAPRQVVPVPTGPTVPAHGRSRL
ncbi:MAG: cytochrome c-type biogenesis CcmF C-terminal domain-containing protein, partial [Thermoanaerobaculia bacterium]